MRFHHSLRYRVVVGFAGFGALVSVLLTLALYFAAHDLSQRLIDETLTAELDDYVARRERNPQSIPPSTVTVHGYVTSRGHTASIPQALTALPPGWNNVHLGDVPYRVLIADRQGERYFLLHDLSLQERRETRFVAFLATGVLVMTLLSSAVGFWLAGRVIAPVAELAQRVRTSDPDDWPSDLAEDFSSDEVGELARVFETYLSRLHAFIERERILAADLSHELRTPLAVIQGATEVLLEDDTLTTRNRERLERIERAAHDMTDLSSALLLMAREDRGGSECQPCSVLDVLEESLEKHRYLINGKPIELHVDVQARPQLRVERTLLFIVLSNLIRNAFNYTESGEIRIVLRQESFLVQDTGSGIPARHLDHVFLRHFRGTSKGTGIGLSLTKRICDRYGWEIRVESREGIGTTAEIVFERHADLD